MHLLVTFWSTVRWAVTSQSIIQQYFFFVLFRSAVWDRRSLRMYTTRFVVQQPDRTTSAYRTGIRPYYEYAPGNVFPRSRNFSRDEKDFRRAKQDGELHLLL